MTNTPPGVLNAKPESSTESNCVDFTFKHSESGEIRIVSVSFDDIQNQLSDWLSDKITCDCESVGETNVVECNCEDYLWEFELQDRSFKPESVGG